MSTCITNGSTEVSICAQALKGEEVMVEALLRNVYGNDQAQRQSADTLARYVQRCAIIKSQPLDTQILISF